MDLKITKMNDILPICPHCHKELDEVYMKTKGIGWVESQHIIYFCPHCRKVIGFGSNRMM